MDPNGNTLECGNTSQFCNINRLKALNSIVNQDHLTAFATMNAYYKHVLKLTWIQKESR